MARKDAEYSDTDVETGSSEEDMAFAPISSKRFMRAQRVEGVVRLINSKRWLVIRRILLTYVMVDAWVIIYADLFGVDATPTNASTSADWNSAAFSDRTLVCMAHAAFVCSVLLALEATCVILFGGLRYGRVLLCHPLILLSFGLSIATCVLLVRTFHTLGSHLFYAVAVLCSIRLLMSTSYHQLRTRLRKTHKAFTAGVDVMQVIDAVRESPEIPAEKQTVLISVAYRVEKERKTRGFDERHQVDSWSVADLHIFLSAAREQLLGRADAISTDHTQVQEMLFSLVESLGVPGEATVDQPYGILETYSSCLSYMVSANRCYFFLFCITNMLLGATTSYQASLISKITGAAAPESGSSLKEAVTLVLAFLGAYVTGVGLTLANLALYSQIVATSMRALYGRCAHTMMNMNSDEWYQNPESTVKSIISADMARVENTLMAALFNFVAPILNMIVTLAYAISVSPQVGTLALTILPLLFASAPQSMSSSSSKSFTDAVAKLIARFQNGVACQRMIWVSDRQLRWLKDYFLPVQEEVTQHNLSAKCAGGLVQLYVSIMVDSFVNIHLALLSFMAMSGSLSLGTFTGLLSLFQNIRPPAICLANSARNATVGSGSVQRVDSFLAQRHGQDSKVVRIDLADIDSDDESDTCEVTASGDLQLNDISFTYPGSQAPVLSSLSLQVPAGKFVALMGGSGCGKSTLLSVLMTWALPSSGSIVLGGQKKIGDGLDGQDQAHSLRDCISVVFQDKLILDGTVHDNIAFSARGESSRSEVEWAAKAAGCASFINEKLPQQYDTVLGSESSVSLSGGQAQRICIARALCCKPSILLLDEATSALDPETEAEILSTIYNLRKNYPEAFGSLIVFSITHRPDTLKYADTLVRMESGKIASLEQLR